jgi:acetyl esterase/lipase
MTRMLHRLQAASAIVSPRASALARAFEWPNSSGAANIGLPETPEPRLPSSDLRDQFHATLSGSVTLDKCRAASFGAALCLAALLAPPLHAQRLMSAADLGSLVAGPPTHRITYGPSPLQFVNLRLPKAPGPHPVVVFIHGGCWLSAFDIAHAGALEQAFADSGFAVWSIEYRRVGDAGGGWPGTFTDVARAADLLRTVAAQYDLDLNRVIAAGHSAGGAFALWLAARSRIAKASELYAPNPLRVRAVFGLAPAPDLERLHETGVCGNVIDKLMGGSPAAQADRYAAASLMQLAPVGVPQTLLIGMKDQTWGPIGRSYYARTQAVGDSTVRFIELPESGHFEMINPASSSWGAVMAALKSTFAERAR